MPLDVLGRTRVTLAIATSDSIVPSSKGAGKLLNGRRDWDWTL